jgi:hypothetical protein
MTLLDISDRLAMQIVLSLGGALVMIVAAILLRSIGIKPALQPQWTQPTEHVSATFPNG